MDDGRNTRDDQYEAEVTDSDEIDVLDFPPDRPMGVGDLLAEDVTAAGEYAPDDLRRRQRRLNRDVVEADDLRITSAMPGGISDPGNPYGDDDVDQLIGERGRGDWEVLDPGAVLSDSAAADHLSVDGWPAEEAALHLIDDRPPAEDPLPTLGATRAGISADPRGRLR